MRGSLWSLYSCTVLWVAKLTCCLVLLSFLIVWLKAELMLYTQLRPRCARRILGLSRLTWDKLIALHFELLLSFLAKSVRSSSVIVMLLLRNRSSFLCSYRSVCRTCCRSAILHCRRCSLGSNMMVLLSVLQDVGLGTKTGAACLVVGSLETDSMANALFIVVKTRRVILLL